MNPSVEAMDSLCKEAEMDTKLWYASRTLWANALVIIAMIVTEVTGHNPLSAEAQVGILGFINLILRAVTKQPINWENPVSKRIRR